MILIPLDHDKPLTKSDILSGQVRIDIEPSKYPTTAVLDELKHPQSLHDQGSKFNDTNAYEYLRGTVKVCTPKRRILRRDNAGRSVFGTRKSKIRVKV